MSFPIRSLISPNLAIPQIYISLNVPLNISNPFLSSLKSPEPTSPPALISHFSFSILTHVSLSS